jgi:branched-chain amino acid aminotransferase
MAGSQDYAADPRNETALVYLNGALVPRAEAKISIFDAGFGLGDGVWEGMRLHRGRLLFLGPHLNRLFAGARAIDLDIGLDRSQIERALYETVTANGMTDGVHLRLMVTRGLKATVNQDPRHALGQPTIAITAEYKTPALGRGLHLYTASIRCTPPYMFDMRLNSHSRLNLIRALLEAIRAGADEALMLDPDGMVASCNATNFFCVRDGAVMTAGDAYCFNGITRANVMKLCLYEGIKLVLGRLTLETARGADEAFVTGTLGGITPVRDRPAGRTGPGDVTIERRLRRPDGPGRIAVTDAVPVRIAMWSGPRNISTAMMRSFGNRADTAVVDEPFYAAYLAATGLDHPMRAEILASQPTDWRDVAPQLTGPVPDGRPIFYQKHMTHHMLPAFGRDWMRACRHAFLIRSPEAVLRSYQLRRDSVTLEDIGFRQQAELFERACDLAGCAAPVIDATDVLANPAASLRALCAALNIPFDTDMLHWPAGPRPTDGVWAPAWYAAVERSTGFGAAGAAGEMDAALRPIAAAAAPYYAKMAQYRLQISV